MQGDQLIAGRYRLVEEIGSGGMGVVWRAVDEQSGTVVALKRALLRDAAGDRKLRREARLAAEVDHPHVVSFLDVVVEDDVLWLVMEYVPSRSLSELLKEAVLPPRRAAGIGLQLAGALEAVHAKGIVHRDVKPANVLITETGDAKLTDFGISRSVSTDETVTESPVVGGTPGYLAPEVAAGSEPSVSSDVFSLGATLYAAVEGFPPFDGDNPYAMLSRARAADFPAPVNAAELAPVLAHLMRAKPEQRPDARGARELIEACLAGEKVGPPRRRRRILAVAAAVVVVAGVAAALLVALPRGSTQDTSTAAAPLPPVQSPRDAAEVGADVRTADPCGLTDPLPLKPFGSTELDPDYGDFNRCDVLVHRDGENHDVDVKVELENVPASGDAPEGPKVRVARFDVVTSPVSDGRCRRILQLPDRYLLTISADQNEPDGVDLCAAADAAMANAAKVLAASGMPRRKVSFNLASLATMDACALLDTAVLGKVDKATKVGSPQPVPDFGQWGCRWNGSDPDNWIMVLFDQGHAPGGGDGKQVDLSGHKTFVLADDYDKNTCLATVNHRSYTDSNGEQAAEAVLVIVAGGPPGSKLCAPATTLAGAVAAKLPGV